MGDYLKFYKLSGATFHDCIYNIYQFIKPFLDNKMSFFFFFFFLGIWSEPFTIMIFLSNRTTFPVVFRVNKKTLELVYNQIHINFSTSKGKTFKYN